ncbi:MAG: hypothetical protein IRY99_09945, partial [Isosphaeraceae bacterium]|nr:hypothetical protein [Isosphaeraceae bacterium]
SWIERLAPPVAVAGLILLLIWSAATILQPRHEPEESPNPGATAQASPEKGAPSAPAPVVAGKTPVPSSRTAVQPAVRPALAARTSGAEGEPAAAPTGATTEPKAAEGETPRPLEVPPGALGVVGKADGIVLRAKPEGQPRWERLAPRAALKEDDRLVGLAPYRTNLQLGEVPLDLIRDTEIRARKAEEGSAARFELVHGRVVVHAPAPAAPIGVDFARSHLKITPPAGRPLGLERLHHRPRGETQPPPPTLRLYVPEGETTIEVASQSATISGPGAITFQAPKTLSEPEPGPLPAWVTETAPSAVDQELGQQFAQYFKEGYPLMTSLVEALEDDRKEIKRLAIINLGATGHLEEVVTALRRKGDPVARRAAITVLREMIGRGADAAKEVRLQLEASADEAWASTIEKLLIGFSQDEATKEDTYAKLIAQLRSPDLSVRELAIENLQTLTHRDAMNYEPDLPELGPGLKNWQDLLQHKELPPKTTEEKD